MYARVIKHFRYGEEKEREREREREREKERERERERKRDGGKENSKSFIPRQMFNALTLKAGDDKVIEFYFKRPSA